MSQFFLSFSPLITQLEPNLQASSNDHNVAKMPEENSNTMPMLSDIDVTLLSEEEMSALREVFERQWVLHEINAERKRYVLLVVVLTMKVT